MASCRVIYRGNRKIYEKTVFTLLSLLLLFFAYDLLPRRASFRLHCRLPRWRSFNHSKQTFSTQTYIQTYIRLRACLDGNEDCDKQTLKTYDRLQKKGCGSGSGSGRGRGRGSGVWGGGRTLRKADGKEKRNKIELSLLAAIEWNADAVGIFKYVTTKAEVSCTLH